MAHSPDPHKTDSFWLNMADEKLANPFITPTYRKRLQKIFNEAWQRETKSNVGLHY